MVSSGALELKILKAQTKLPSGTTFHHYFVILVHNDTDADKPKMLAIQKHIIEHGLEKTIETFKLDHKDYGYKVLLKYNQIESPMAAQEVREARGLVLEKGTWRVMSQSFTKFFNHGEGHAAPIDWDTARVYKKMDGSLINVYKDWVSGEVCFSTTGTAEGEGNVDNFHSAEFGGTFAGLFWKAFQETILDYSRTNPKLMFNMDDSGESAGTFIRKIEYENKQHAFNFFGGYTLAFELCTPYNVIVTPHINFRVYLLGARQLDNGKEVNYDDLIRISDGIGVQMAPSYNMKDVEEIQKSFVGMSFADEGYVVCDDKFNRIKLKNPAYVAVHHMKESTAYWRIVDIVRSGEIDEYLAYFPGRSLEVHAIKKEYDRITNNIGVVAFELSEHIMKVREFHLLEPGRDLSSEHRAAKKKAAEVIIMATGGSLKPFQGYFFSLIRQDKKPADYLMEFDGRELYDIIKKYIS